MSHAPDYSFLGSGIVLIREWGSNLPFQEIGNCSAFNLAPQTNQIALPDHTQPGGGNRNSVERVSDWQLSYTFHDFNKENFARVLRGKASTIAAGDIVDELASATPGHYVSLARIANEIASVAAVGGGADYDEGVDYVLERGMLWIPLTSTIPPAVNGAPNIEVSYSHGAVGVVQAGVTSAKKFEMEFRGANEARSGKQTRLRAHKVAGGMIQQMALLGDEYGAGEVNNSLESDNTKRTSADHSAFFYWEQEE